jgi:hypothetical protein
MTWGVRWASRAADAAGLQGAGRQVAVLLFLGVRGIAERHALLVLPVAVLFLNGGSSSRESSSIDCVQVGQASACAGFDFRRANRSQNQTG